MRIAIVTTSWPASEDDPSGHFVRASARHLEREGHTITVVAPAAGGAFGWPGAAARIRAQPLWAAFAAAWIAQSSARLARLDVDRVISHWAVPCAWPIGVRSHAPLEAVSHGGDVRLLLALPKRVRSGIVRAIATKASVWRFVSGSLLGDLLASLDPAARSLVTRVASVQAPPLDLPDVRAAIADKRCGFAGGRVAVSAGRLVRGKRVDLAVEHLASRRDADVLIVVGDGPERARLERLACARRVDARFVGAVGRREALAWIGAADFLIHASEAEGLSTVVREAEALGTRVLRLPQ